MFQAVGKITSLITSQSDILGYIEKRQYYWKVDKFGVELEKQCKRIMDITNRATLYFVVMGYMVFAIYSLKMFFSENIDLPISCYIPAGWPLSVLIPLQLFIDFNIVTNILGLDALFATACCDLIVQLKLLAYSFNSIDYESIETETDKSKIIKQIGENVDLHNVITQ